MSELYSPAYQDEARPAAISVTKLLGQVMFLVAIALAFCALGTWVGRDLAIGTARILSFAGFGMLLVSSFAGERFRVGSFAMGWLFATALVIGLGLGPVISYFATVDSAALTQAFAGTAATVAGAGALGFFLSKDLAPWMRPLSLVVFTACVATIVISLVAGSVSPWISGGIYLLSAALIVVDFNVLRKHGTEADAIWLATGIFVSIVNIFLSLLNIFFEPLMDTPLALDLASPDDLEARRAAEQRGDPFLLLRDDQGAQQIVGLDERGGSVTIGRRLEADVPLAWDPEVSRLHAELEFKAGEWTLCDDGYSQNGTYVNGLRIHGRRRLTDGDLLRIGQTAIAYCDPGLSGLGVTLAPGELGAAPKFSEQQQRILRGLCRPLMGDGEGVKPATDAAIAVETRIPEDIVTTELDHLGRSFGLQDMPPADRRAEIALLALRSGLVKADEG